MDVQAHGDIPDVRLLKAWALMTCTMTVDSQAAQASMDRIVHGDIPDVGLLKAWAFMP